MKNERKAQGMIALSMLIFGTIGIFRRYIPLPSSLLAMARGAIGTLFLLSVMAMQKKRPDMALIRCKGVWLALSGALMGFNWILLFEAYNYTTVATATLCYYMAPIFVIMASPFLLRERLSGKKLICVAVALLGMVLVSGVLSQEGTVSLTGVLLGLGAAVLYASVVLLNKRIGAMPAYDKTIVQLFSAAAVLLPYVLLTEDVSQIAFTGGAVALLVVVGIVHTGVAYALYFGSMDGLRAQTIALLSYIDPASAILLSALFLHEPIGIAEAVGAVMILGAAIVSELPEKEKH